jgi:hypothetical protein
MKIVTATAFASLLAVGLAGPSFAANINTPANPATMSANQNEPAPNSSSLRDQVRDDMTKAGFTDVKVMPESFLVRAKDPKGNPVMMVINPDSFTEVTTISPNANGAGGANNNAPSTSSKMSGDTAPNTPTPPVK